MEHEKATVFANQFLRKLSTICSHFNSRCPKTIDTWTSQEKWQPKNISEILVESDKIRTGTIESLT